MLIPAIVTLAAVSFVIFWMASEQAPPEGGSDSAPEPPSYWRDRRDVHSLVVFQELSIPDNMIVDMEGMPLDALLRTIARHAASEGVAFVHESAFSALARVGPTRYRLTMRHDPTLDRYLILIDEEDLDGRPSPPLLHDEWRVFSRAIAHALTRLDVEDVHWFQRQDIPQSALPQHQSFV